jgi:hypothetical protein
MSPSFQTHQQLYTVRFTHKSSISSILPFYQSSSSKLQTDLLGTKVPITMSFFIALLLAQLYAIYVSVAALPISVPTTQLWDMQRATNVNAFLGATLKDTLHSLDTKISPRNTELASARPTNIAKHKTTIRNFKTKPLPSITNMPMGGMQCTVM